MSTTTSVIETDTSEWFEVEVSFRGRDDWFASGNTTFDSRSAAAKHISSYGPGYKDFEYRIVKMIQIRIVVEQVMRRASSKPIPNTVGSLQERRVELQRKLAMAEDQVANRVIQIIEEHRKRYTKFTGMGTNDSSVYRLQAAALVKVREAIRKEFDLPKE